MRLRLRLRLTVELYNPERDVEEAKPTTCCDGNTTTLFLTHEQRVSSHPYSVPTTRELVLTPAL
jgi:hypothetical protein